MLLVTGMPRTSTSFTLNCFGHCSSQYFYPGHGYVKGCFVDLKTIKKKYGPIADPLFLNEGSDLAACFSENRLSDIPQVLKEIESFWVEREQKEPVFKHPCMVLTPQYCELFSCVVISYDDVNERWIKSALGHDAQRYAEVGKFIPEQCLSLTKQFDDRVNVENIGNLWKQKCFECYEHLKNKIPVFIFKFGDREKFVSIMSEIGLDSQCVSKYWSEHWRGSRFNQT